MLLFTIKQKNLIPGPFPAILPQEAQNKDSVKEYCKLLELYVKNQKNSSHRSVSELTELILGYYLSKNPSTAFFAKKSFESL